MSKFTTEVRFICEQYAGRDVSGNRNSVSEVIEKSRAKVFSFDYPIFDESYRSVLESKILRHFYTREIGEETVGLWKLRLETKMCEVMPYYNQLYKSELLEFNPLYTHMLERKYSKDVDESAESSGRYSNVATSRTNASKSGSSNEWDKYSDTPQGSISGIESDTYLTNARNISGSSQSNGEETSSQNGSGDNSDSSKSKSVEGYLENVAGYEGVNASKLLMEYRESFLNIDMMVIEELEVLFMQLW